jgi:hypothetical protein
MERSLVKVVTGKRPAGTGPGPHPEKLSPRPQPKGRYPQLLDDYRNPTGPASTRRDDVEPFMRPGNPQGASGLGVSQPKGKTSIASELEAPGIHSGVRVRQQNQREFNAKEVPNGMRRAADKQINDAKTGKIPQSNPKKRSGTQGFGAAFGVS